MQALSPQVGELLLQATQSQDLRRPSTVLGDHNLPRSTLRLAC